MHHNGAVTPRHRLVQICLPTEQTTNTKSKKVSEAASLRHSQSPGTKRYPCLSLSIIYFSYSSHCNVSTYTQLFRYPLAHKVNSTTSDEKISLLASCHTLQPKAIKQNSHSLGRMKYVSEDCTIASFLHNLFCQISADSTNSINRIMVN